MSDSSPLTRVLRQPARSAEAKESSALLVGAAALVVGTLIGLFVFWDQDVPISGRGSVGVYAAVGGAIAAIAAFVFGCAMRRSRARSIPGYHARLHWFDVAALALALGVIALLGFTGLASLLSESFVGALVYGIPAAVLGGVAMAIAAYMSYLSAVNLTPMLLSLVLALFLAVGALASMLSASDPLWWTKNLSTLGISDDISALTFNVTLIIAGVMVTTIAHYATAFLPADGAGERRGRNLVRFGLILIGILLACVGIFPVDEYLGAHNLAATGMAIVYVAMVVSLPALLPSMPKVFVMLGYVYVGVIVVLAGFFISGYYNLTAVELVVAVLVFSWVIVFLRNTGAVEQGADAEAYADAEPAVTKAGAVP
ncbi:hypothetical protein [Agromyces cerinus]|uniref:DUF998 domain-containing protein n=1 Tax=Agromyces cerinus subsp. cerinus TaxID=232089 RepID=A0A1N6I171_9MICO|nr:hypothetical protein [Agromyces cerinus]SIO25808.1 hypothetical protein SAMN05443544_3567 [Agromyces cerinus subsp. cerinus]